MFGLHLPRRFPPPPPPRTAGPQPEPRGERRQSCPGPKLDLPPQTPRAQAGPGAAPSLPRGLGSAAPGIKEKSQCGRGRGRRPPGRPDPAPPAGRGEGPGGQSAGVRGGRIPPGELFIPLRCGKEPPASSPCPPPPPPSQINPPLFFFPLVALPDKSLSSPLRETKSTPQNQVMLSP